jgi:peptide/nickel transport system permease protein
VRIWRRLLTIVPLLLAVTFIVFCIQAFIPGDPAVDLAGERPTPERIEEIRQNLELDRPLVVRYVHWVGDALHGDLGKSLYSGRSVTDEIRARWPVTLSLVIGALLVTLVIGVPLGILAGRNQGGPVDRIATFLATLGASVPNYVMYIFLAVFLSLWLKLFPIAGYVSPSESVGEWLNHLFVPVLALSFVPIAEMTRQLRSALIETLSQDYIRTARAKGLPERTVVLKHALRVAISPTLSVLSVNVSRLLGGAILVEYFAGLPGIGLYLFNAVLNRDLPIIYGVLPLMVVIAVGMNIVSDVAQAALNPRLRAAA